MCAAFQYFAVARVCLLSISILAENMAGGDWPSRLSRLSGLSDKDSHTILFGLLSMAQDDDFLRVFSPEFSDTVVVEILKQNSYKFGLMLVC